MRRPRRAVPVLPAFNSFFRCSRCNFGGFRFFRLRRGRLSLLRGAFRCLPGMLDGPAAAFLAGKSFNDLKGMIPGGEALFAQLLTKLNQLC